VLYTYCVILYINYLVRKINITVVTHVNYIKNYLALIYNNTVPHTDSPIPKKNMPYTISNNIYLQIAKNPTPDNMNSYNNL
jgi:hypothetical protein